MLNSSKLIVNRNNVANQNFISKAGENKTIEQKLSQNKPPTSDKKENSLNDKKMALKKEETDEEDINSLL